MGGNNTFFFWSDKLYMNFKFIVVPQIDSDEDIMNLYQTNVKKTLSDWLYMGSCLRKFKVLENGRPQILHNHSYVPFKECQSQSHPVCGHFQVLNKFFWALDV